MYLMNESAHLYEKKLISEIACGIKNQKVSVGKIVRNELLFFESRIKIWCLSEEEYFSKWTSFLSECGCGSVSGDYIKRLISQVASEQNIKRTNYKYRSVVYE